MSRRRVPPEFVVNASGVRLASPAYSAVELAATDDGRTVCEFLRLRLANMTSMEAALASLRGSPGHTEQRTVLAACDGNPWSYAELRLHRILRSARITDWVANQPILIRGHRLWPDVRFRKRKLVLEFDGRAVHDDPDHFLSDRERQNIFEADGYHVLRFGWEHLDNPGYIVATTHAAERNAAPT